MSITVTVLIFSGRPDPSWKLVAEQEKEILQTWEKLPFQEVTQPPHPKLGYQGCRIDLNSNEYIMFVEGSVYQFKDSILVSQRIDNNRQTERLVLNTAPGDYKGIIGEIINF